MNYALTMSPSPAPDFGRRGSTSPQYPDRYARHSLAEPSTRIRAMLFGDSHVRAVSWPSDADSGKLSLRCAQSNRSALN
jgi:hypothetical protein